MHPHAAADAGRGVCMPTEALRAAATCGRAHKPACTCSMRPPTRTEPSHVARTSLLLCGL
eukprot:6200868-Pleurochrysis_carterae.AAC.3